MHDGRTLKIHRGRRPFASFLLRYSNSIVDVRYFPRLPHSHLALCVDVHTSKLAYSSNQPFSLCLTQEVFTLLLAATQTPLQSPPRSNDARQFDHSEDMHAHLRL
ncbi:hypothetical protein BDN71DRAFT_1458696 [Pleurotus eryngii]|uniref:Uncharacterized protein n=1 Tax=Pleurotus eryngii TaxID=5323 RepID=A0A9P5ZJ07_PLEER|nr:hypothetical protein BDN71DRAFT_1458696 [Pleurotus eryngii]